MTLAQEVQKLSPDNMVTLYELDTTNIGGSTVFRFTGSSGSSGDIPFNGHSYVAIDMVASGFEWNGQGSFPKPKIQVGNVNGLLSSAVITLGDLVGANFTRIRTFKQFLDNGSNPDPSQILLPDYFQVEQKVEHNKRYLGWTLSSIIDQTGRKLPGRVIVRDICPFTYRVYDPVTTNFKTTRTTCPWGTIDADGGNYYNENDTATTEANDMCSKRLTGCKKRYGAHNPLPFGKVFPVFSANDHINRRILDIALASPLQEVCGFITCDGVVVQCPNVAPNPVDNFYLGPSVVPDDALAIWHSHPNGPFAPSRMDMQQQIATALPWGIAAFDASRQDVFWFGDEVEQPPLIGRGFRHAVTDCYALIRHAYKTIHNIDLLDFPRDWDWWYTDQDLFINGYKEAGFHSVPISEALPADVLLFSIRAGKANHSAFYLGRDLILHHSSGRTEYEPWRLSTVESVARFYPYLVKVLRHENHNLDRTLGQKIWPHF